MSAGIKLLFGSPRCRRISGEEIQLGKRNFGFFSEIFLSDFFQFFFSGFLSRLSVDYRDEKEENSMFEKNCYFMIFPGEGK